MNDTTNNNHDRIDTAFYTAKGGQGCSVLAAVHAIKLAVSGAHVLLVTDHLDDMCAILGVSVPIDAELTGVNVPVANGRLDVWDKPRFDTHAVQNAATVVITDNVWPEHGQRRLLVTQPCYLAFRRAAAQDIKPTGVVLVTQPGRAFDAEDAYRILGVPVVAEVPTDPAIARAIDAGLLVSRLPSALTNIHFT